MEKLNKNYGNIKTLLLNIFGELPKGFEEGKDNESK